MTSEEVRQVAKSYRDVHIPLDSIYLDIDYMERYKDFTVDRESFGDFEELVEDMKKEHIHLVPIIDAGVKVESYLPKEEIEERFWEKCEEPAISPEAWHPMETFLEQLR